MEPERDRNHVQRKRGRGPGNVIDTGKSRVDFTVEESLETGGPEVRFSPQTSVKVVYWGKRQEVTSKGRDLSNA